MAQRHISVLLGSSIAIISQSLWLMKESYTVCIRKNFERGLRNFPTSHLYCKVYIQRVKLKELIMYLCIWNQKMVFIMQKIACQKYNQDVQIYHF